MKKFAAALVLLLAVPARGQQAQPDPAQFLAFGLQVTNNLEQGRAGVVWDRASAAFKASIPKDRFIAQATQNHQMRGTVVSRVWQSITRRNVRVSERPVVERPLIIVTFASTTNKNVTFYETVQFSLEADNLWHTANYTSQ